MSANGPLHQPRRTWAPGRHARLTLQLLAASPAAVPDCALLRSCHTADPASGRKRTMTHYRRDILHNLHDRGYIEPGPQPRTWRLRDAARAEMAHVAAGQGASARLTVAADEPDPADARLRPTLPIERQTPAEMLRPDLRAAATGPGLPRSPMSAADRAPCLHRAGADDALQCPSRRGNRLYWRDGRVTTLDGSPVAATA